MIATRLWLIVLNYSNQTNTDGSSMTPVKSVHLGFSN